MSASGVISGTPTTAELKTFEISATYSGTTSYNTYDIEIFGTSSITWGARTTGNYLFRTFKYI